ncbi:hypothetical protein F5B20DRAFT_565682 [Whalleya microplaca]|nr:hypothetical protein F5B20DRAFT_565682 [Whalleya microplaca]
MAHVNLQQSSPLFRLPQELRDEIYTYLFLSTTIEYGAAFPPANSKTHKRKGSNSLEITRTCHRAKRDVGDTWLRLVFFIFRSPKAMLDVLAMLPVETRSKVGRVCVSDLPLRLGRKDGGGITPYSLHQVLKLLPGLRLDYFVVSPGDDSMGDLSHMEDLLKHSNGWKELHHIFKLPETDELLCSSKQSLLAKWNTVLENRDGAGSQPLVTIDPPAGHNGKESSKYWVVVAKRGVGVDYEEKVASPWIKGDIRQQKSNAVLDVRLRNRKYKWKELRELYVSSPDGDIECVYEYFSWNQNYGGD